MSKYFFEDKTFEKFKLFFQINKYVFIKSQSFVKII